MDSFALHNQVDAWARVSRIIREPAHFHSLHKDTPPPPMPGPPANLSTRHSQDALSMGIFAPRAGHHRDKIRINRCFSAYKDEQWSRLILWPKELNDQGRPETFVLITRDEMHAIVLWCDLATEDDGRDWFYQFPTDPSIWHEFGVRFPGYGIFVLTVLCMGWVWSMVIAHTASVVLSKETMRRAGIPCRVVPYADNFLLGVKKSPGHDERLLRAWRDVTREANALMKGTEAFREILVWLGLVMNFAAKTIGVPDDKWSTMADGLGELAANPNATNRQVWAVFGAMHYYLYFMGRKMLPFIWFHQWMRRRAAQIYRGEHDWDGPAQLWPTALQDLYDMHQDIGTPATIRGPPEQEVIVYTDACEYRRTRKDAYGRSESDPAGDGNMHRTQATGYGLRGNVRQSN